MSTWLERFLSLYESGRVDPVPEPEPAPAPEPAKPRGVVVTRTVMNPEREFTQALDEYPDGDYWALTLATDGKVAFLAVFDAEHRGIATYTPGSWDRIETGTAENIKTKVEEPNKP